MIIDGVAYSVSYNKVVSYSGSKLVLNDLTFGGVRPKEKINDKLIFSKVKYRNNKVVGQAKFTIILKGIGKEGKLLAKQTNAKLKDAFSFEIVPADISILPVTGSVTYTEKSQKYKFKLMVDAGGKKSCKLKYNAKNPAKSDFTILDAKASTVSDPSVAGKRFVTIEGKGNFKGILNREVTVK